MKHRHLLSISFSLLFFVFCLLSSSLPVAAASDFAAFPSNSRLSFLGKLASGNTAGTSLALIKTTFDANNDVYSVNSGQLVNGDNVWVGSEVYLVATTSAALSANEVALSNVLTSGNIAENTVIYNKMTGQIKLEFTPTAGINGGAFTFFVPAASTAATANDGIPDSGGFDFNNATITCPSAAGYSFVASATSSVGSDLPQHVFTCTYTGTSTANQLTFYLNNLINPAPGLYADTTGRTIGSADLVGLIVSQQDASGASVKGSSEFIGFANAVKMTVQVLPQLTFSLNGVNKEVSTCGIGTDETGVDTNGLSVPFGTISNTSFVDAAQVMTITTNAADGYVVSAVATDQLGLDGQTCANFTSDFCIPFASAYNTNLVWDDPLTEKGFGYTMQIDTANSDTYLNGGVPNVTTVFNSTGNVWRGFPNDQFGENPLQIITNARSTQKDTINICYRIVSSATNVPGDYRANVIYTITASF